MPDDTVPAEVLARWLGVSERLVRELARKGIVVKAGRNAFKLLGAHDVSEIDREVRDALAEAARSGEPPTSKNAAQGQRF